MGPNATRLLKTIDSCGLADRSEGMAQLKTLLEHDMLSETLAKSYLFALQAQLEELKDYPNYLHRPPTAEQLYDEGEPDVEVGSLIEGDGLRFGLRLRGKVPHVLAAGSTGSGKTTLLRVLVIAVEDMNESET